MDPTNNFSDILNSLMNDPKVSEIISNMTAKAQPSAEDVRKNSDDLPDTKIEEVKNSESSGINIPPEILASLPQMMSALSGINGVGTVSSHEDGHDANKKDSRNDGHRKALLYALKPYLSEKRCAVIDGLLQFENLSHILSALNKSK